MRSRRERHDDFASRQQGWAGTLSSALLECAGAQLRLGLKDRTGEVDKTADNHCTPHAAGSIVLLVDGFEAWLNEAVWVLRPATPKLMEKEVAKRPVLCKYRAIPEYVTGTKLSVTESLKQAVGLRHEIVHWLPYARQGREAVPKKYTALQQKGLFITAKHKEADFNFEDKLQSYKLARWCWEEIETAVRRFVDAVNDASLRIDGTAANFSLYKSNDESRTARRVSVRWQLNER